MITVQHIREALSLQPFDPVAAHRLMAPMPRALRPRPDAQPRQSAVMLLLFEHQGEMCFVMIQRPEYPGVHSGQIGLPGGRHEDGETFLQTAMRETEEEVGVSPEAIEVIGQLTPIYIPPSDFEVHPFVGYVDQRPHWHPDPVEVAAIIEMPLSALLDAELKQREMWTLHGMQVNVPFYAFDSYKIWGATAIMLSELENRLLKVLE